MPFNAVKTYLADAFLKQYKVAYEYSDETEKKEMLEAMKDYSKVGDSDALYEWIENYLTDHDYIFVPSFASDLFNDIKENMGGSRGIAREMIEEFEKVYCIDHGVPWDKSNKVKAICDECEKAEEEEGDVDCECCEGNYTRASCMMAGGKMTCSNCFDECQFSETCKIKQAG